MTDEQMFLFDLQGYVVLEGVLDRSAAAALVADMDAHDIQPPNEQSIDYRYGGFLEWGPAWRNLIDQQRVVDALGRIIGPKFRLDHAYGMAQRAETGMGKHGGLHHIGGMFDHGCYYVTHGERMHNGLVVASFALTDVPEGAGGFCCVPGTHKSLHPMPGDWYRKLETNPVVRHVPMRAGDVLIFTEALTHGTMPWRSTAGERRSVLLKYCPHYMQWAQKPMDSDLEGLTDRQRRILDGAYVWQRTGLDEPIEQAATT